MQTICHRPDRNAPAAAVRRRFGRYALAAAVLVCLLAARASAGPAPGMDVPAWLPRYDLDIRLDVAGHQVLVHERVTWTNRHSLPSSKVVFNAHSHYAIPKKEVLLFSKTLEILRLAPSDALDFGGPPLQVQKVSLLTSPGPGQGLVWTEVPFAFQADNATALEVNLPAEVRQGDCVTLEVAFVLRLPQRQGRWGQWEGVTFLAQWLPVLAFYDDQGWQPTPFVPWHQPFFNEAGSYTAHITLPAEQKLGCTGSVVAAKDLGNGWLRVEVHCTAVRDFALFCSAHFEEHVGQAGGVRLRCLALPGHAFYGQEMIRIAAEAVPVYQRWFGPYPYPEFTIVESYFGWNGNECGGLVMIDARIFAMPHMATNFVDQLVSHEICHQWWYNVVGTNGYAETWMDEALAVYFSHRLIDAKVGKNNLMLNWPTGLEWLPNIHRDDYRYYGLLGTLGRGDATKTVQDMPKFGHLVTLMSMTYDRGGKIVGMIEDRLGEAAFFDFMRQVYAKYQFRILRVADYQRELEAYTGRSWEEFFTNWLYGAGMTDWSLEHVEVEREAGGRGQEAGQGRRDFLSALRPEEGPCRVTVLLRQKGEYTEPTVLGFCLNGTDSYQVRVPILPEVPLLQLEDPPARIEVLPGGQVRVEVHLPCAPTQITVDPDQVLLDRDPTNNNWKPRIRLRLTPLYFELDETDLTNAYDKVNLIAGPWLYGPTFNDPWYTRSPMAGVRAGVYRTQQYTAGAYMAYRSNDRNFVAGVDGLVQHWPWPQTQVGFNVERSVATVGAGDPQYSRGVAFGRYVFLESSSLYLPPSIYVEGFGAIQDRGLPTPFQVTPGGDLFNAQTVAGLHFHNDLLTPYWDPEHGFALDATYESGIPFFGENRSFQKLWGQVSAVKSMPDWFADKDSYFGRWLAGTRWAGRVYGGAALPDNGQLFTLGGGELFRGFDPRERQGSLVWIASLEWRVPLAQRLHWDCCDHLAGLRNIYGVAFYDIGNAYLEGRALGPIAHAVGGGLRFDVAWFSLIERTILRLDFAKTLNEDRPLQVWVGVEQPF